MRPFVQEGTLVACPTVHATLSCDHRAIDGSQAAAYLEELQLRLENPERLLTGLRLGTT